MEYILISYVEEGGWSRLTRTQQQEGIAAYAAFTEALEQAGAFRGSNRLGPSSAAATVRIVDGEPQVLDGPYADTKEQLGGYFLIDVPDRKAALAWAQRCPAAGHGIVEVRPLWSDPG